jgi:hypothetical protein
MNSKPCHVYSQPKLLKLKIPLKENIVGAENIEHLNRPSNRVPLREYHIDNHTNRLTVPLKRMDETHTIIDNDPLAQ